MPIALGLVVALADWLVELAVYGTAVNPLDPEIAYQLSLSLAIENWYLVALALNLRSDGLSRIP